jgi:hypothetical protein
VNDAPRVFWSNKNAKAAAALAYEESMGKMRPVLTIFGLKNMAPDDYKDKHEHQHDNKMRAIPGTNSFSPLIARGTFYEMACG